MSLLIWGLTIGTIGKLVLGIAVLRVHAGILHEHKIDGVVLKSIKKEKWVTLLGLTLIVIGYLLEIMFYGGTPLASCTGAECAALIEAAIGEQ